MLQSLQSGSTETGAATSALERALRLPHGLVMDFAWPFDDAVEHFTGALMMEVPVEVLQWQLDYEVDRGGSSRSPMDWFVASGDWSAHLKPIRQHPVVRTMTRLAGTGADITTSRPFQRSLKVVSSGGILPRQHVKLSTPEDVAAYYGDLQRMIAASRRFGILPRPPADLDTYHPPKNTARPAWLELTERNIGVGINADGSLVRVGPGKHRLAVAIALGLPTVPCELRLIHRDWLEGPLRGAGEPLVKLAAALAALRDSVGQNALALKSRIETSANTALRAATLRAREKDAPFFFPRNEVPPHVGGGLLVRIERRAIRGVVNVPDQFFLSRSGWKSLVTEPFQSPAADITTGPPWQDPPPRIAIGFNGSVYLCAPSRPLPDVLTAEVAMIHVRHIHNLTHGSDRTVWDTIARCVRHCETSQGVT